jgi:hypothetical protein
MSERPGNSFERRQRLHRVLVQYMDRVVCPAWPGADGLTVEDVVGCYQQALAAGQVPGLDELMRLHPELSDELRTFFGG